MSNTEDVKRINSVDVEKMEKIAARELLLFFRNTFQMSPYAWKKFCLRYADRDISTIIKFLKKHGECKVTPKISIYIERELSMQAQSIRQERNALMCAKR